MPFPCFHRISSSSLFNFVDCLVFVRILLISPHLQISLLALSLIPILFFQVFSTNNQKFLLNSQYTRHTSVLSPAGRKYPRTKTPTNDSKRIGATSRQTVVLETDSHNQILLLSTPTFSHPMLPHLHHSLSTTLRVLP